MLRSALWKIARPIAMVLSPEASHETALRIIRAIGRFKSPSPAWCNNPVQVFGMEFRNPLGLAGGFDKNAECLLGLASLGFGFVEIGTVTPRPQGGNPRPRLFRETSSQSLFNCMGFNNLGAGMVARNLENALESLGGCPTFRIGLSIGKNAQTPLPDTANDLRLALGPFKNLVSYVAVNVSSPNTKGLRSLQDIETLLPLLTKVREELSSWKNPRLILKLMPELQGSELQNLLSKLSESQLVDGFCLTNTLAGEWLSTKEPIQGGWSGGRVAELAKQSLVTARTATDLPILSVGGVLTSGDYRARLELGAQLVQTYTGFVYGGPSWPQETQKP